MGCHDVSSTTADICGLAQPVAPAGLPTADVFEDPQLSRVPACRHRAAISCNAKASRLDGVQLFSVLHFLLSLPWLSY